MEAPGVEWAGHPAGGYVPILKEAARKATANLAKIAAENHRGIDAVLPVAHFAHRGALPL